MPNTSGFVNWISQWVSCIPWWCIQIRNVSQSKYSKMTKILMIDCQVLHWLNYCSLMSIHGNELEQNAWNRSWRCPLKALISCQSFELWRPGHCNFNRNDDMLLDSSIYLRKSNKAIYIKAQEVFMTFVVSKSTDKLHEKHFQPEETLLCTGQSIV